MTSTTTNRVRELNDAFRAAGPVDHYWVISSGIYALGAEFTLSAIREVQAFCDFSADNDPYDVHDFGGLSVRGEPFFWFIVCYGLALAGTSPDASDPEITRRVLTIKLASEM